jgi:hypothetical protein
VDISSRYSDTDGSLDLFSPPGGTPDVAFDIPNYNDVTLWALEGQLEYRVTDRFGVGLWWLYEDYDIDSFLTSGLIPYMPAAPFLDLVNGTYQANVIGAQLRINM